MKQILLFWLLFQVFWGYEDLDLWPSAIKSLDVSQHSQGCFILIFYLHIHFFSGNISVQHIPPTLNSLKYPECFRNS